MGIFFSKKQPKVTSHDRAVLDLKVQRDKLKQYHIKINAVIERENEIIKVLMKENRRKQAMLALKKRVSQKFQEQLLEKSVLQLDNIQQMVDSVEFTVIEHKVFASIKEGNKTLQALHDEMSVEDVDELMADTADAIAYQNEIEAALSGQLSQEDEDDILAQLDALEREVSGVDKLPSVPVTKPEPVAEEPDQVIEDIVDEEPEEEPEEEEAEESTATKTKKEKVLVAE